jgi:hypothetical protein
MGEPTNSSNDVAVPVALAAMARNAKKSTAGAARCHRSAKVKPNLPLAALVPAQPSRKFISVESSVHILCQVSQFFTHKIVISCYEHEKRNADFRSRNLHLTNGNPVNNLILT